MDFSPGLKLKNIKCIIMDIKLTRFKLALQKLYFELSPMQQDNESKRLEVMGFLSYMTLMDWGRHTHPASWPLMSY